MIVQALSVVYGTAATWRRQWYARRATRTKHLARPVISIGNLRVGGSGKTPAVACLARLLLEQGERPVILSRGYRRERARSGVTLVSDRERVLADLAHAGDEPLLLARALPGVPVLVCADRFRAGLLAESTLAATVHLLDDGFQHVRLARDIDLLLVDQHDLDDRVLPAGRLREPLANAAHADAALVPAHDRTRATQVAARLGVPIAFHVTRSLGAPAVIGGGESVLDRGAAVFAVAGIARPERFFDDLRAGGYVVAGTRSFRDHHPFAAADVASLVAEARRLGVDAIVTTDKDAVRLEPLDLTMFRFARVPLHTSIEPKDAFASWIADRLIRARATLDAAS